MKRRYTFASAPAHVRAAITDAAPRWETTDGTALEELLGDSIESAFDPPLNVDRADMPERMAAALSGMGGLIRCEVCGAAREIDGMTASAYCLQGWPQCCATTMRWWTQAQIDGGEMPLWR